jgi:hypothetical protein
MVQSDGSHVFETIDPLYVLPINGFVRRLTMEGSWTVVDVYTSMVRSFARLRICEQHLYDQIAALQKAVAHLHNTKLREQSSFLMQQRNEMLAWRFRCWLRDKVPAVSRTLENLLRKARSRLRPIEPIQT